MSDGFASQLRDRQTDPTGRRWVYVPYDQLTDRLGPLLREDPEELGIVAIESPWKARQRPYHKQKLALVLANQRHFLLEQAGRGIAIRFAIAKGAYRKTLQPLAKELGPLRVMRPAERELRRDIQPLVKSGALELLPHEGFLTTSEDFATGVGGDGSPWRMDRFYRHVRKSTGILMVDGEPAGGKFSFDGDNRKKWNGKPPAPQPPRFRPDAIVNEVVELVAERFADHPGELDPQSLPATAANALRLWLWARKECLTSFGPYQDAMSSASPSLFHTRISPLLHLHRLLPKTVIRDVVSMDIPIASKEGFVRQVLGWREFVRHVHEATDGFRKMPDGFELDDDGEPLPDAYWGTPSGMHCLDSVVQDVWREGYGHHITRLMVLSNIATLLDISPRELSDWFWVAYTDAFDWVVEPNVLGMGTYATGDLMTTKPYVSGAAYIDRMSDYCKPCAFDPKKDCPIRFLYWAYLDRHEDRLAGNRRLSVPLASMRKRKPARRRADARVFEQVFDALQSGEAVTPDDLDVG